MRNNRVSVRKSNRVTTQRLTEVSASFLAINNIQRHVDHQSMDSGQSIAINLHALSQQEPNEKLLYREAECRQLISNIKNSINTAIYGPAGSGKTSLLKHVAVEANSSKIRAIYIDCSLYQTANAVLREILIDRPIASRTNYDLLKKLIERAKSTKFVIFLDHIEYLKQKEIIGQLVQIGICVVIAIESVKYISAMHQVSENSIAGLIGLESYAPSEAVEIIQEKMSGYINGITCSMDTLVKIIQAAQGNLGWVINILKAATMRAQGEKRESIEDTNIDDLISENECIQGLNADETLILRILRKWKSLPASRLLDLYIENSRHPKSERSFRIYLENLCSRSLIKALGETRGRAYEIVEAEQNGEERR